MSFFSHENQACPPSISQLGQLRTGTKSDLVHCLETLVDAEEDTPEVEALLLDGAAVVHMLKPGAAKTFQSYAHDVFVKYVNSQLQHVRRIDIIWDSYNPDSLKATARAKRGSAPDGESIRTIHYLGIGTHS